MSVKSSESFQHFYEAHAAKVRGLLFRLAGEDPLKDLTQEAFMKAWEHRAKFREESTASTWIFRIAYNCAVDYLRKNRKLDELPTIAVANSLESDLSNRQLVDLMLSSLSVENRAVVVLYYLEDQSIKEISEALSIPEGTVKSRLSQARSKMTELLERKGVRL
ncbi:MAG: RNA polymerase sigma-E factor [Bdellovibrio sp. ArHS]|uniref:sigma-70 family RNA polymerase sigma factor n=1 Tax=Bdellovibrio sp. ArHS TaxID=1569284 RepID=UPI0005837816|nr:sigma-70 family RNA polymerase sigma factor [Bdellovibrio sp. ArHS]KHD87201.1 MAG: RNA polymerase sigma-E factor [Bdellovibrio sp. ArHS]